MFALAPYILYDVFEHRVNSIITLLISFLLTKILRNEDSIVLI